MSVVIVAVGLAVAVTTAAQLGLGQNGNRQNSVSVGGVSRSYVLHVPPQYDGKTAMPLVIVLHGGGGNAGNAERMSGFSSKADREAFLVAYPNGSGPLQGALLTWNSGTVAGRRRGRMWTTSRLSAP